MNGRDHTNRAPGAAHGLQRPSAATGRWRGLGRGGEIFKEIQMQINIRHHHRGYRQKQRERNESIRHTRPLHISTVKQTGLLQISMKLDFKKQGNGYCASLTSAVTSFVNCS